MIKIKESVNEFIEFKLECSKTKFKILFFIEFLILIKILN